MIRTLFACLLVLAASTQVRAHGGHPGRAAAGSSKSHRAEDGHPRPDGKALCVPDTSRFGSSRGPQLAIAGNYARFSPHLAELQDAGQPDSSSIALLDDSAEFNPEAANLPAALAITLRRPAAPLGHRNYRTRLVRVSRFATRREAVEILTCTYAGPLVLAQLPASNSAPAQLLGGPGYDQAVALRPLALTQAAVLQLCGDRAPQVRAYAMLYNLHFQQADEVARLLDYYNRIAVIINK